MGFKFHFKKMLSLDRMSLNLNHSCSGKYIKISLNSLLPDVQNNTEFYSILQCFKTNYLSCIKVHYETVFFCESTDMFPEINEIDPITFYFNIFQTAQY